MIRPGATHLRVLLQRKLCAEARHTAPGAPHPRRAGAPKRPGRLPPRRGAARPARAPQTTVHKTVRYARHPLVSRGYSSKIDEAPPSAWPTRRKAGSG